MQMRGERRHATGRQWQCWELAVFSIGGLEVR